jgi:hypothetical protein
MFLLANIDNISIIYIYFLIVFEVVEKNILNY